MAPNDNARGRKEQSCQSLCLRQPAINAALQATVMQQIVEGDQPWPRCCKPQKSVGTVGTSICEYKMKSRTLRPGHGFWIC
jgi:hypothetical protein